jgi:iron complex transport system ATP-binding protein
VTEAVSAPALAFEGLSFAYRPGAWVLRRCSGAVQPGRVLAVLGPNGRGKSTLLKLLLGVLRPQEGSVHIQGRVAFVPQLFDTAFGYSALDMVLMGRARHVSLFAQPSARDEAAALTALDRFGIADLAARPFHDLSGGQRQMVVLARALVAEAQVLLLDEPTSALDLRNQALALRWMARLAREDGLAVVFTTHHPHHAFAVADDALLMLDTDRFASGPADTVLSEANLRALYDVPLRRVCFEHDGRTVETLVPVLDKDVDR